MKLLTLKLTRDKTRDKTRDPTTSFSLSLLRSTVRKRKASSPCTQSVLRVQLLLATLKDSLSRSNHIWAWNLLDR